MGAGRKMGSRDYFLRVLCLISRLLEQIVQFLPVQLLGKLSRSRG